MCGILGQVNRTEDVDHANFEAMLSTLSRRGPDQSGLFYDTRIAFGHRRLSIIDLSDAGIQPMANEDGTLHIIFNGEIYNYLDVKKNLTQQYQWRSTTDTEVLLRGFEEYGKQVVQKIEGMFAVAFYDSKRQTITMARDHFGKKPLYYYVDDQLFCFASELKALLKHPRIRERANINTASLQKYLFYGYVPSPHCIVDGIQKLEAATVLQFDIAQWKIVSYQRFWGLENVAFAKTTAELEMIESIDHLLNQSVKKRMMADVPVGIFLSGGVDSTTIAGYCHRLQADISSFTVSYAGQSGIDETVYAKQVAHELGMPFNNYIFDDRDVLRLATEILDYIDEPFADAAVIPLYAIARFAKPHITVALSGDGGDEVFGGYPKYRAQQIIEQFQCLVPLLPVLRPFIAHSSSFSKILDGSSLPFPMRQFIFGSGSPMPTDAASIWAGPSIDLERIFEDAVREAALFRQKDAINQSLYLDCKIQLPDWYLVKGDRATMAASLEMRNPFLDKTLAEYLFSLPGNWKIRQGETKYLLKKIAATFVDPSLVYRKKKGFAVPLNDWIRGILQPLYREHCFRSHGYFNNDWIEHRFQEHLSGRKDHTFLLMRITHFNYWYDRYYAHSS